MPARRWRWLMVEDEREASGGEYASRCAPCGVMHACIGETGQQPVRLLGIVVYVSCSCWSWRASTLPQPHGDTHTLDIWTSCDDHKVHGARSHSVAVWRFGRHWRMSPQCYQLIPLTTRRAACTVRCFIYTPQYTSLGLTAASGLKNTLGLALRQGFFACTHAHVHVASFH